MLTFAILAGCILLVSLSGYLLGYWAATREADRFYRELINGMWDAWEGRNT